MVQAGLSSTPGLVPSPRPSQGACTHAAGRQRLCLAPLQHCGRRWGAGGRAELAAVSEGNPHQPAASPPRSPKKNPTQVSSRASAKALSVPALAAHRRQRARCGAASPERAGQSRDQASPGVFLQAPFAKGMEWVVSRAGAWLKEGKLRHRGLRHRRAPRPNRGAVGC